MDPYQRGRGEPKLARDEARAASAAGTKPECLRLALVPAVRVVSPEEAPSVVASFGLWMRMVNLGCTPRRWLSWQSRPVTKEQKACRGGSSPLQVAQ